MDSFIKQKSSANRNVEATRGSLLRPVNCETCKQLSSNEVRQNLQRALCTLKRRTGAIAPGILCEAKSGGQLMYLFVTTHIDLPTGSPKDLCDAVLNFPALKKDIGISINLPCNSIVSVWGDRQINSTVVELSNGAADECRSNGAHFLKVGTPNVEEVR